MTEIQNLKSHLSTMPWIKPILKSINNARCEAWDLIHGVDTCGEFPLHVFDFQSKHKTAGLEYHSHHPSLTHSSLKALPIRYEDYTFIDIGCGKGRALLIASEFPFRRIVGLEFAPPLAELARRNAKSYRSNRQRRTTIEIITGDALDYELSDEPQVLYLYSPFAPELLDRIMQRIEDSFQQSPRDLLIMFSGTISMRNRAVGSRPEYEQLARDRYMDIYRHRQPASAAFPSSAAS